MSHDPRGAQGPTLRGPGRSADARRSIVEVEEELATTRSIHSARSANEARSLRRHSHFQHHPQHHKDVIAPLHDPAGKPLRRHGTETIGDVLLHPLKEMKLHHQRMEAYEKEKKEWNEKHPESIASDKDIEGMKEESIM